MNCNKTFTIDCKEIYFNNLPCFSFVFFDYHTPGLGFGIVAVFFVKKWWFKNCSFIPSYTYFLNCTRSCPLVPFPSPPISLITGSRALAWWEAQDAVFSKSCQFLHQDHLHRLEVLTSVNFYFMRTWQNSVLLLHPRCLCNRRIIFRAFQWIKRKKEPSNMLSGWTFHFQSDWQLLTHFHERSQTWQTKFEMIHSLVLLC